jgi:hypothetical protein
MAPGPWQVYLLHYSAPIGDTSKPTGYAQHYTGSTPDLARRMDRHRAGSDAKITRAFRAAGAEFTLARTWVGGRKRERQIKSQGGARRYCPVCKGRDPQFEPLPPPAARAPRWQPDPAPLPEPEPLWESVAARLDPADVPAFLAELEDASRAAWNDVRLGEPGDAGREALACDLTRLLGAEASAARRLEAERQLAIEEGWWPAPADREPADLEAG